jgi:hypothetical protein
MKEITLETLQETIEQTREIIEAGIPKYKKALSKCAETGGFEGIKQELASLILLGETLAEICRRMAAGVDITEKLFQSAVVLSDSVDLSEETTAWIESQIRHPDGKLN